MIQSVSQGEGSNSIESVRYVETRHRRPIMAADENSESTLDCLQYKSRPGNNQHLTSEQLQTVSCMMSLSGGGHYEPAEPE